MGGPIRLFIPEESEAFHDTWEAIAEKDALRFVALQPGSLLRSFLISKENRDSNHYHLDATARQ